MNFMTPPALMTGLAALAARLRQARAALKPPPRLNLVEWADATRVVSRKTSASPGRWRTSAQPVAYGPMLAVTEGDTHTVTAMVGTQLLKSELMINTALFFMHQDPSGILFVQPTQTDAKNFSKERFEPTLEETPAVRGLVLPTRARNSATTRTHKPYPGGALDFVGANSPGDLASRPKRVIVCDEIDKYPVSAGDEGDPLALAEERASTFKKLGLAKFVRACSPTVKGTSRIGREYEASDQRRCFVACAHCGHNQVLTWDHVRWEKLLEDGVITYDVVRDSPVREHRPRTAAIRCEAEACGTLWTERERIDALDALVIASDHGWRQTRRIVCCGEAQAPERWDAAGRALCSTCGGRAPYGGHAGFHASKIYSKRHDLADIVREFLNAAGDPELTRKFVNTALAELFEPIGTEAMDGTGLHARREAYGPDDLPEEARVITGFADVQGDRLEVQLVAWGPDEECWPFVYEVIPEDPAQPAAWIGLDEIRGRQFRTRDGRVLRIAAFGIDTGGHHGAQVYAYCRRNRGQRVFPTAGRGGKRPIWPVLASKSKTNDRLWLVGVDAAKEAIYARLRIAPPAAGERRPGFIHFPREDGFGPTYFAGLTVERRELRHRAGQAFHIWVCPPGKRNEPLDTFVGALAVRKSLPRRIERSLEYAPAAAPPRPEANAVGDGAARPSSPVTATNRPNPGRPIAVADNPYL